MEYIAAQQGFSDDFRTRTPSTLDFPEEAKLLILPDHYQTVSLAGAAVQIEHFSLESAIAFLKEQYAVGTVRVKIVQPKPS